MNVQPSAVAIAPPIVITLPTTTAALGATFVLPITVSDTTGDDINFFSFDVVYNPAVIVPTATPCSTTGTLAGNAGFTVLCFESPVGTLNVIGLGVTPLTGVGTLVNLNFTTAPSATVNSVSPLTFGPASVEFNNPAGTIASSPVDGQVTITAGTTAGEVSISGRVLTQAGNPIRGVRVSLLDSAGNVSSTLTNAFGYFRFDDVEAGETYVVTARSKRYTFPPRVINVGEEVTGLDFVAEQ